MFQYRECWQVENIQPPASNTGLFEQLLEHNQVNEGVSGPQTYPRCPGFKQQSIKDQMTDICSNASPFQPVMTPQDQLSTYEMQFVEFQFAEKVQEIIKKNVIDRSTSQISKDDELEPDKLQLMRKQSKPTKPRHSDRISQAASQIAEEYSQEAKNIPKNYGKNMANFILHSTALTARVLETTGSLASADLILQEVESVKTSLTGIEDLRKLWLEGPYAKQMRILTNIFVRRHAHKWMFSSKKLGEFKRPLKYRLRILQGIQSPEKFTSLRYGGGKVVEKTGK